VHPEHALRGRSFSQFVDVQGGTLWRTDFYVRQQAGRRSAPEPRRLPHARSAPAPPRRGSARRAAPRDPRRRDRGGAKTDWLVEATRAPGTGLLFPPEGHNPRAPALRVAIRHEPSQHVDLWIAGARSTSSRSTARSRAPTAASP
jgi:hypothetical protein